MWPNDADGLGWANPKTGQPPLLKAAGYKFVDGGRFQDGTQDYTPQISKFKSAGCQILSGVFIPPDFVNFWKQSYQQGFKPKVASVGKALLFPAELRGDRPDRLRPHHRGVVVAVASVQVVAQRRDLRSSWPTHWTNDDRQGVGAAAAPLRRVRGRRRRPQAHHERRRQGSDPRGHRGTDLQDHPGSHHCGRRRR